jgi:hypothetical protein
MLSGEATDISFIVLSFTRSGHEPTIYHTQGEHADHYTTDAQGLGASEKNNNTI